MSCETYPKFTLTHLAPKRYVQGSTVSQTNHFDFCARNLRQGTPQPTRGPSE